MNKLSCKFVVDNDQRCSIDLDAHQEHVRRRMSHLLAEEVRANLEIKQEPSASGYLTEYSTEIYMVTKMELEVEITKRLAALINGPLVAQPRFAAPW